MFVYNRFRQTFVISAVSELNKIDFNPSIGFLHGRLRLATLLVNYPSEKFWGKKKTRTNKC